MGSFLLALSLYFPICVLGLWDSVILGSPSDLDVPGLRLSTQPAGPAASRLSTLLCSALGFWGIPQMPLGFCIPRVPHLGLFPLPMHTSSFLGLSGARGLSIRGFP